MNGSVSANAGREATRDLKPNKRRKQSGFRMPFQRIVNLELGGPLEAIMTRP
jgi:hypothetical protein